MGKDAIDKEVGYSCSYVPLEILDFFGINATYIIKDACSADTSQGYLSQNICGLAKDICSRPRTQVYDLILTDCCDAMVNLHESFHLHHDIPLVRIETNHEYDLPLGQMATRLEAALEML